MDLFEAFKLLEQIDLEESAKTDFIDRFGEDTFDHFIKAKDRLVNKGYSVDFGQYLKMSKEEIDNLILSLYDDKKDAQKKRIIKGTDKEIRGQYRDLGIKNGYHVYEPLDVYASMDLGVNTGWCTTGRYGHYGHPEFTPSLEDAKQHWNDYTKRGIRFFYLLDPETMYGKYAITLYPEVLEPESSEIGRYSIERTNIEIYNDEDELDYTLCTELDISALINEKVVFEADVLDEVEIRDNVLIKYRGSDQTYKIPDNITSIGDFAFEGCKGLTSITIPDSVTSIGIRAFDGCTGLMSITISDSVTSISWGAFINCSNLRSITIPAGVASIASSTFSSCTKLKLVTIPNSVTAIMKYAFLDCTELTSVTIPNSVTKIGLAAFRNCTGLTSVTIGNGVTSIGKYAFSYCKNLTNITIPNSVKSIGMETFRDCSSLALVSIPNSVTSIGNGAFYKCSSLAAVNIPNGVTSIGAGAFSGCSSLAAATIGNGVTNIGDYAFFNCRALKSVTIPASTTNVGHGGFSYCKKLTSITIPDSMTSIEEDVFDGCESLEKINYNGNNSEIIKELSKYAATIVNPKTGKVVARKKA